MCSGLSNQPITDLSGMPCTLALRMIPVTVE